MLGFCFFFGALVIGALLIPVPVARFAVKVFSAVIYGCISISFSSVALEELSALPLVESASFSVCMFTVFTITNFPGLNFTLARSLLRTGLVHCFLCLTTKARHY